MAQKKDLNISPYYDDFNSSKNFYKVLFKPGFPVQARELTTLQSILQNQIENFGSHIFKEGSVVIPGDPSWDSNFNAVKLEASQFGVDISLYIDQLLNKTIEGETSGITATVKFIALPDGNNVEDLTIYVKYTSASKNDFITDTFIDGESLIIKKNIVYGNTTITAGSPVVTLISLDATKIGSAAHVDNGVYFVRGNFVTVNKQTIILDHYTNTPSYRIGLKINESIVGSKDDSSLYDNAKGFSNYAAPGADRLKIELILTKKSLDDTNDTDFIEILKTVNGEKRIIHVNSQYNLIRDYLADRTVAESGSYAIDEFDIDVNNSLNDRLGSNGIFYSNQKTQNGNDPSDDIMCVRVSSGEAYVNGYDVQNDPDASIIDVNKPRDTEKVELASIDYKMGSVLKVNTVSGQPQMRNTIELYDTLGSVGNHIGDARLYSINSSDSIYSGDITKWELHLYDIQTYTTLTLTQGATSLEVPITSYIKGVNSGASGYVASHTGVVFNLRQTSGTFIKGEEITINGKSFLGKRSIVNIRVCGARDIKSVKQLASASADHVRDFKANAFLESFPLPNGVIGGTISGGNALVSPGNVFTGISTGSIIRYQVTTGDERFNKVTSLSPDGKTLNIEDATSGSSVVGVFDKSITNGTYSDIRIGAPSILEGGKLYVELPDANISSVDFVSSTLSVTSQVVGKDVSSNSIIINTSDIKDGGGTGISSAFYEPFTSGRYSVFYGGSGAGIGTVTNDTFVKSSDGTTVTLNGLENSNDDSIINVTSSKQGIQSKVKNYERSQILNVTRSQSPESGTTVGFSLEDGLTYNNQAYGLRVQDEHISLNVPDVVKVLAVYESKTIADPTFDTLSFPSSANVSVNGILGENIIGQTSNAIARVVTNNNTSPSSGGINKLGFVYLNDRKFDTSEIVLFEESNITTSIENIENGTYEDISKFYVLDKGQRDEYYDYSRIVRKSNTSIPTRRLMIVFDKYTIPTDDSGDVFTVLSYDKSRYTNDIPKIGSKQVRATDTFDFRPRVSDFGSTIDKSPFDFTSRTTGFNQKPNYLLSPDESSIFGYEYYLGRIDKVYLSQYGIVSIEKGQSSRTPAPPAINNNLMELGIIKLPPYLYNPKDAEITLVDNRRYTMRDIGILEDRIEELETVTTLSLLEIGTESLTIQDANGRDRFKSGFFVDNFKNTNFIDLNISSMEVDGEKNEIRPIISKNSLTNQLLPSSSITDEKLDLSIDYELLDANIQKTGNSVTLKYDETDWIEQSYATRVENVNPFHVTAFVGTIILKPNVDIYTRTIRLDAITTELVETETITERVDEDDGLRFVRTETRLDVIKNTNTSDVIVDSGDDKFMRSRNVRFDAINLKPYARHYQFLNGNSDVDFIPKLIEISGDISLSNYGSDSTLNPFEVGETVIGYSGGANPKELISFRVAKSNHKFGRFDDPKLVYGQNPYVPNELLQDTYTTSSKVLNVDTFSLASEAQGLYSGYLEIGMKLIGQNSKAAAFVKDLRLISDQSGGLTGCFFLRDPNTDPQPSVVIDSGKAIYRLTTSKINATPLRGSKLISSGQSLYESRGTFTTRQVQTANTTLNRTTIISFYDDPLAQSFTVGGVVEAPSPEIGLNDDDHGVFVTSADIFFANKDSENNPVTAEIRTVELGTPTRVRVGNPVTLRPDDVLTSTTGDTPTNFKFPEPIYLSPGKEYALVLLAPSSVEYEVWIGRMGETTQETQNLPDVQKVVYSQQWSLGSLFKSQNGSIWTPDQLEDLKFKLYKAKFSTTPGSAFFANPSLDNSNGYITKIGSNPINTIPRKGYIGIDTVRDSVGISSYSRGRKIANSLNTTINGIVVGTGSSVATLGIATGGVNYRSKNNVSTYNIIGQGRDLKVDITANSDGIITTIEPNTSHVGSGYTTGDVVGIVTAEAQDKQGRDALIFIDAITGVDTLYLSNMNGSTFTKGTNISYFKDGDISATQTSIELLTNFVSDGGSATGQFFKVNQFDHGMHGTNNKLILSNIKSNLPKTSINNPLAANETGTISVASTIVPDLSIFEGLPVSNNNPGYVKIGQEIIGYTSVGIGVLSGTITRSVQATDNELHIGKTIVEKYELNGVSLRRINRTHNISANDIELDSYNVELDITDTNYGTNRSADDVAPLDLTLTFDSEGFFGESEGTATRNIQYEALIPKYDLFAPSDVTSTTATIRTVSGTSIDGNEVSFIDQGFEPIQLNQLNRLNSPRIICSKVNENEYLSNIERNKSLTTGIRFETTNENVSPIINLENSTTEFRTNRMNNPISDYASDGRVNSRFFDPHSAIYVSNLVSLNKPADGLKVILSAYRSGSSDFRVLYSLRRPDSVGVSQEFELFPGYDNLDDTTGDGFGDKVINAANNNGRSDAFVTASLDNQFLEYEFTADNLGEFTAYQIKIVMSGTNQAYPVRIKELRTIALK